MDGSCTVSALIIYANDPIMMKCMPKLEFTERDVAVLANVTIIIPNDQNDMLIKYINVRIN